MSTVRFSGDSIADAIRHAALDLESERIRLWGKLRASLAAGAIDRDTLAELGAVLVEVAALREVRRVVLPEVLGNGEQTP